ncbi:MAG: dTMP kinase [Oscillospiraceae bacterium]|nr:dTMP kinase [Oscillospiraceae bacterium]
MRYDTILFDLDGTLTESGPGIMHSAQIAAEKMGFTGVDPAAFARFIGPPLFQSFQALGMTEAQAEQAMGHYRAYFAHRGLFENAVYPGIPNLLRRLRAGGTGVYLATAKPQVFAERILAHFGLARFFDGVVGIALDDKAGDKPTIVRAALPKRAGRAAMVGDRAYDIDGGKANGIDTVGVCYGYGTQAELAHAGATHLVDTVTELAALLAPDVPIPRGFFVTVEGLDGSGKTTQIDALGHYLTQRGYEVVRTREPGGSPIAEQIRRVVLSPDNLGMHPVTEALLYAAARAEHVQAVVRPALAAGKTVLCDRFVDSSVAYQGGGRALGVDVVRGLNAPAVAGTMPDATLLLRVDAATAMGRRSRATASLDRIEVEREAFHQRVFDAYEALAQLYPDRICAVDATAGVAEITRQACARMDAMLAAR